MCMHVSIQMKQKYAKNAINLSIGLLTKITIEDY
jgi:hypothetical protein